MVVMVAMVVTVRCCQRDYLLTRKPVGQHRVDQHPPLLVAQVGRVALVVLMASAELAAVNTRPAQMVCQESQEITDSRHRRQ